MDAESRGALSNATDPLDNYVRQTHQGSKTIKNIEKMADKPVSRILQTEFPISRQFCKLLKHKLRRHSTRR